MADHIAFTVTALLPQSGEQIARNMLDLVRWPEFRGFWPIPGIRAAEFELRTPEVVGTRIRVVNRDGSSHVEEIVDWQPAVCVRLVMSEFSPPLSRLALRIAETWEFAHTPDGTRVVRSFRLEPRSWMTIWPLRLIAVLLKKAIRRHLNDMKMSTGSAT